MYLLELASPTGMVFTKSLVEGLLQPANGVPSALTRYDIKEGGQRLHLYVDPATKLKDIELYIPMDSKFEVTDRMPAQVSLIDYYNPSKRQTIFYLIEESDDGIEVLQNIGCSLALSCDMLQKSEAIVLGYPGESEGDFLEIRDAFPYKACGGDFVQDLRLNAKFVKSLDRLCVPSLSNAKSFFMLQYGDEGQMEIIGMTAYDLALPKIAQCFPSINSCEEPK